MLLAAILLAAHSTPHRVTATAPQLSTAALQLDPFLSGLTSPVLITNARDGTNRLFIVEQAGIIKVLQPGSTTPTVFLNITSRILTGGERGLLGLAFHPQYETNRRFFVHYTRQTDGAGVIAEYRASVSNPDVADATETVLLTIPQPFSNHNGGMIEFGPDGFLYIAKGDGGSANDPGNRAQNINELLGKILRINVDIPNGSIPYSSPPTNPFFGATPGADEIYAVGLRNPWRFSFDRSTGQLYVGDVGQGAREEVDIITLGGNYGWRVYEGSLCTGLDPPLCNPANYIFPITEYSHAGGRCSITGGYAYRGSQATFNPGTYLFADFCTGEIFKFEGGVQSLLFDTTINIASFGEDEAGEIYVVGLGGTVHKFTNPQPACTFTIDPSSRSFGSGGGMGSVAVTTQTGCAWTAMSNAGFITVTAGASGAGNGTVSYSVAANPSTSPRTGTITIAGQTHTVNQAAASCSFTINPTEASYDTKGGTGAVAVSALAGCNWTAQSFASWISVTGGASGSGSGMVNYSVAANTTTSLRTGSILIAGQTFTVTQSGASCITGITPQSRSVGALGASATVNVTAISTCNWTAQSLASWISITSGGSGPGSKTLKYAVATNTGASPRTGVILIGGLQHTVTQAGASCSYSISPLSQSFASAGGNGTVNVTTATGCAWTAMSNAGFISVTAGASGSGSGVVSFSVAANTATSPRSGTILIAGQIFTVDQAASGGGGCSYSINPTSQNFASAGGSGTVNVTTAAGCAWTAVSNAGFISVTAGASGTGSGVVSFSVAANSSTSRTGTMTIAGQIFTVSQEASACSYSINPINRLIGRSGGTGTITVTAPAGCAWTAVSSVGWLAITAGASGSGNGVVSYTVSVNTSGSSRTGTITIGGRVFTIKQSTL
jgi:hypothetical protein